MTTTLLRGEFLQERNSYIIAGEPTIFHCHHYNCYLQACLLDTSGYLPGIRDILVNTAQEIAHGQFQCFFEQEQIESIAERKHIVEDYFRFCGYGIINLAEINKSGGIVSTSFDHYGIGWKLKFGNHDEPVSFFTRGFLAGAFEAIYNLPLGRAECHQYSCLGMGDPVSSFEIELLNSQKKLTPSPKEGLFQKGQLPSNTKQVDYKGIREALINMPLEGSQETGLINAFDVMLTRHYANYYTLISYKVLRLFESEFGKNGSEIARELLIEAGHVCAFNTFGGIMQSNEWNALIKPQLKTETDWVHGIVAVVNALGWGFWKIESLIPGKELIVKITSGYESNAYLKTFGESSSYGVSFLATGGISGIMNLVFLLNLPNKIPLTLDNIIYNHLHRHPDFFDAFQEKCRAKGDQFDRVVVTKKYGI